MEQEKNQQSGKFESVFSSRLRAGKRRTYFFDVHRTRGEDMYLVLTESTKRFDSDFYERHKIFLYKEDFNRFVEELNNVVNHIKTELMPDYDYDEFTRRNEEFEARRREEQQQMEASNNGTKSSPDTPPATQKPSPTQDDDMSW